PTNTPANTFTTAPTGTPTTTPSPTNTRTNTPLATGTGTPANTPTAANTQTPTHTVTVTQTQAPTPTPSPSAPVITSGVFPGSTVAFGHGAPNIPNPQLEIWSAGANGIAENGGGDDVRLGTGGTDAAGNFDVALSRALVPGDRIYPIDRQHQLVGPVVVVASGQVPDLNVWGAGLLGAA